MRRFCRLGGTSYQRKPKSPANRVFYQKFENDMAKRNYINPAVIAGTMRVLEEYKRNHPQSATPMADACAGEPTTEKRRYVRAAQRLGWPVVRSQGHVYENGVLLW